MKILSDNKKQPAKQPFTVHDYLFRPENDGNKYISIDIKSAIFVAYHKNGIIPEETWQLFLQKYTKSKFLLNSKKLRLKIFGKVNHGEMNNILVTELIIAIWDMIKEYVTESLNDKINLLAIEGDEIVLVMKNQNQNEEYGRIIERLKGLIDLSYCVNITCFQLKFIQKHNCYVKLYCYPENEPFDLKCVNFRQYVNVHKQLTNVATTII